MQRQLLASSGDRPYKIALTVVAALSLAAAAILLTSLKRGNFDDECSALVGSFGYDFCRQHHDALLALTALTPYLALACVLGLVVIKRTPGAKT